jgi:hypothetical protein
LSECHEKLLFSHSLGRKQPFENFAHSRLSRSLGVPACC